MKKRYILNIILSTVLFLSACGAATTYGVILEIEDDQLLLAQNLSAAQYEEIKDTPATDLQNEAVAGERADLNLMYVTYENTTDFNVGDQVDVWLEDQVAISYPPQAKAKKMKSKK